MDWASINAGRLYTRTQALRLKIGLEDSPAAQYHGQDGYVTLFRAIGFEPPGEPLRAGEDKGSTHGLGFLEAGSKRKEEGNLGG